MKFLHRKIFFNRQMDMKIKEMNSYLIKEIVRTKKVSYHRIYCNINSVTRHEFLISRLMSSIDLCS